VEGDRRLTPMAAPSAGSFWGGRSFAVDVREPGQGHGPGLTDDGDTELGQPLGQRGGQGAGAGKRSPTSLSEQAGRPIGRIFPSFFGMTPFYDRGGLTMSVRAMWVQPGENPPTPWRLVNPPLSDTAPVTAVPSPAR
jgi:hypothetical protein